jgi:hypothetical protein
VILAATSLDPRWILSSIEGHECVEADVDALTLLSIRYIYSKILDNANLGEKLRVSVVVLYSTEVEALRLCCVVGTQMVFTDFTLLYNTILQYSIRRRQYGSLHWSTFGGHTRMRDDVGVSGSDVIIFGQTSCASICRRRSWT